MAGEGADFLSLSAAALPARGKAAWLAQRIRDAVADGMLAVGEAMPATRSLADDLGVSRGVVVECYRRLTDEGLLTGTPGAGTRVADLVATAPSPAATTASPTSAPVRERPLLDLSPGVPDLAAFPRAAWLRAERAVLGESDSRTLGYGEPRGHPLLRAELARWLARHRGVRVAADQIVITAGVAQALALLARTLRAHGVERIGMEDPGSRGVRDHLAAWGQTMQPLPVDEDGLDVAALEASALAAVVVTPAHQFPTGVVLAPARRRALAAWAGSGESRIVIEDDYDAEHRYDRAPVPALHSSAPHSIAYTGSVSKTLAPGLRLGWVVPPPHLLDDVVAAKYTFDIATPALAQLVLARLMADGDLDRHLRGVRLRQRRRRDALLAGLRRHLPDAQVHGVAAGLHLLVTLPGLTDDEALAARLADSGVVVQPLSRHCLGPPRPGVIVGYAAHSAEKLAEAAELLATALASLPASARADDRAPRTKSRHATRQPTVRM